MSYNVDLPCGCLVYVSTHPVSGVAHTRIVERRSSRCPVRLHDVGLRLTPADVTPDCLHRVAAAWEGGTAIQAIAGAVNGGG
jgi:hypothetical protein